jgi:TP901 family phage tail tape measure protein
MGAEFDRGFDAIRIGTGATGEALDALKESAKNVFADTPASFDQVSVAIADLNTRLGLTGEPLEALAQQFLNLSRITGSDVAGNIESATRVFGDWGIVVEDQAAALDQMFRASQSTGIGIDQLGRTVVQFGAPLRQMGFDFEESIGIIGKFEKEGVNAELVLGSMRVALSRLAKAGESAPEAFQRMTQSIAEMEDPTAATAAAMELFGTRAGPDMAAAIREGDPVHRRVHRVAGPEDGSGARRPPGLVGDERSEDPAVLDRRPHGRHRVR